jgi:hypothetical protein
LDLAPRDYILAEGAIELVVEGVPCSAFIEPSQSCELIFCAQSDRLRGRKHAGDGGKFRRDLQEQKRRTEEAATKAGSVSRHGWFNLPLDTWRGQERAFGLLKKVYAKRAVIRGKQQPPTVPAWAQSSQDWPISDFL